MSDDFEEIESALLRYRPADPRPQLRDRVLLRGGGRSFYWEALAASLLLGIALAQLSSSSVPPQRLALRPVPIEPLELALTAEELQFAHLGTYETSGGAQ